MLWVCWHPWPWWERVARRGWLLLLLQIGLVLHRLLGCHVVGCHARLLRDAWTWDLRLGMVFGRLDGRLAVDAVLVSGRWLWSVQTRLEGVSNRFERVRGERKYLNEVLALGLCDERL